MSDGPLNERQLRFCREYLLTGNASEAYRRAGYAAKDANVAGPRLFADVRVQAEIARLTEEKLKKWDLDADELIQRITQIATADPGKVSQHRIGACRFCYGIEHEFQWTTQREYREARLKAELKLPKNATRKQKQALPTDAGGYGYDRTREPNAKCPECNGLGVPFVTIADTTKLTGAERLLFEAIEQTNTGIKVKLADRGKAIELLAKHLGIVKEKHEHDVSDPLKELIARVQGTPLLPGSSPAAADPRVQDDPQSASPASFMPGSASDEP